MHHIPTRRQHVNINPWPAAMRRIGWFAAILFIIASLPLIIDWSADQLGGVKKRAFPWQSLALLLPGVAIPLYLIMKRKPTSALDVKYSYKLHYLGALLFSCAAVYLMWGGMYSDALDRENPASYPYPAHGIALIVCNWISFILLALMAATLWRAAMVGQSNRYDTDDEPL